MKFRFEATHTNELGEQTFDNVEYPTNLKVVNEFEMGDDTRWNNIMLQFAKFLDAVGYVGVHEKVSQYTEDEWDFITNQLEEHENTSNPGLSD